MRRRVRACVKHCVSYRVTISMNKRGTDCRMSSGTNYVDRCVIFCDGPNVATCLCQHVHTGVIRRGRPVQVLARELILSLMRTTSLVVIREPIRALAAGPSARGG